MDSSQNDTNTTAGDDLGTYTDMFSQWLTENPWTDGFKPLVFHVRKLCAALDQMIAAGALNASAYNAYTKNFLELEAQRPGKNGPGELPGQTSIFDPAYE